MVILWHWTVLPEHHQPRQNRYTIRQKWQEDAPAQGEVDQQSQQHSLHRENGCFTEQYTQMVSSDECRENKPEIGKGGNRRNNSRPALRYGWKRYSRSLKAISRNTGDLRSEYKTVPLMSNFNFFWMKIFSLI